jgi:hypothetical protein
MRRIRIAILTRPHYRSQRFLAEGLARMLQRLGVEADVYLHGIPWLEALGSKGNGVFNNIKATLVEHHLARLADYDLFILSDTMRAFQDEVNLDPLIRFAKPIIHYEVFYAGGSKYWLERLPTGSLDKYDAYLVASSIHGVTPIGANKVYPIGLDLLPEHPLLVKKGEFTALLDFPREGYEEQQCIQENALRRRGIKSIRLKGEYSYIEIERIYQQTCIAFVSCPEAFGVPIAQLQHYGSYIASPDRMWVMRHALLPPGAAYFDESSPKFTDNFCFYRDEEDLTERLAGLMKDYDPSAVRGRFLKHQPTYSQGNLNVLWEAIRQFV